MESSDKLWSSVRATLMTRPRNNNNKANIYTKTIEWLYSWDPSESGNPKRSKLRIWASFCWSLYTTKLSMSHFLIKPLSHVSHPLFIHFPHYSSNFPTLLIQLSHMSHRSVHESHIIPWWLSLSIRYPFSIFPHDSAYDSALSENNRTNRSKQ